MSSYTPKGTLISSPEDLDRPPERHSTQITESKGPVVPVFVNPEWILCSLPVFCFCIYFQCPPNSCAFSSYGGTYLHTYKWENILIKELINSQKEPHEMYYSTHFSTYLCICVSLSLTFSQLHESMLPFTSSVL